MEKGDLSNGVPPRVLIVGNDFLVKMPQKSSTPMMFGGRRSGKNKRLVDSFDIEISVRNWLHDLSWRRSVRVDLVMVGWNDRMCELLHDRLDRLNLSVAGVYGVSDVQELVNRLAYMPEVLWVVHGNPAWQLAFGPKARYGIPGLASI